MAEFLAVIAAIDNIWSVISLGKHLISAAKEIYDSKSASLATVDNSRAVAKQLERSAGKLRASHPNDEVVKTLCQRAQGIAENLLKLLNSLVIEPSEDEKSIGRLFRGLRVSTRTMRNIKKIKQYEQELNGLTSALTSHMVSQIRPELAELRRLNHDEYEKLDKSSQGLANRILQSLESLDVGVQNSIEAQHDKLEKLFDSRVSSLGANLNLAIRQSGEEAVERIKTHFNTSFGDYLQKSKLHGDELEMDRRKETQGKVQEEREEEFLNTLAASFVNVPRSSIKAPLPETCHWIRETNHFKEWLSRPDPQVLLLTAPGGHGKSVMARYIIDTLHTEYGESKAHVFQFFCSYQSSRNTDKAILSSMIHDMLSLNRNLFHHVKSISSSYSNLDLPSESLFDLLRKLLRDIDEQSCFWIVDGLDECSPESQKSFLKFLVEIAKEAAGNPRRPDVQHVRILVTSRPSPTAGSAISYLPVLEMNETNLSGDIENVIHAEMRELAFVKQFFDSKAEAAILENVTTRASASFLWVDSVFGVLRRTLRTNLNDPERLDTILDQMPETMEDFYRRTWSRIDRVNRARIYDILSILLTVFYPLTLQELAILLVDWGQISESNVFSRSIPVSDLQQDIEESCNTLVRIVNGEVQIAHASVRDFLLTHDLQGSFDLTSLKKFHFRLFRASTKYLLIDEVRKHYKESPTGPSLSHKFPFINYAAGCWLAHLRYSQDFAVTQIDILKGVQMQHVHHVWVLMMEHYIYADGKRSPVLGVKNPTLLHSLVRFGCAKIINVSLLSMKQSCYSEDRQAVKKLDLQLDVGAVDACKRSPLHVAILSGSKTTVTILLENGGDPNQQDDRGESPLHYAVREDNSELLQILLNHGADSNLQSTEGHTSLHLAARYAKDLLTISSLLDTGAEMSKKSKHGFQPIHNAAVMGHESSTRLLLDRMLEKSLGVDSVSAKGLNLFHMACFGGSTAVLELLCEKNLIIRKETDGIASHRDLLALDSRTSNGLTGLSIAADKGHLSVVEWIVERGLRRDVKGRYQQVTSNHTASDEGDPKTMKAQETTLTAVDDEIDVNGWSPLFHAIRGGHAQIVQYLLKLGANLARKDAQNKDTALHVAAIYGNTQVLKLILDHGAEVEAFNKNGNAPLQIAAYLNNLENVKLLVNRGADMDHQDDKGFTPLMTATQQGNLQIVEYLLEIGANFELCTNIGSTALSFAVSHKRTEIVKILAAKNSGLHWRNSSNETLLAYAIAANDEEIVQVLLENGHPTIEDESFSQNKFSPLQEAARKGNRKIFQLLLKYPCDLHHRHETEYSLLQFAVLGNNPAIVDLILGKKLIDPYLSGNDGLMAVHICESVDMVKVFENHSIDLNLKSTTGWTLFAVAAAWGRIEILRYLRSSQFDIDETSAEERKWTALHAAASAGHRDVIEFLLQRSPCPYLAPQTMDGSTPLHMAIMEEHTEIASILIRAMIDNGDYVSEFSMIDTVEGASPLHYASKNGMAETIQELLNADAELEKLSNSGFPPLAVAVGFKQMASLKQLINHGADLTAQYRDRQSLVHLAVHFDWEEGLKFLIEAGASIDQVNMKNFTPLGAAVFKKNTNLVRVLIALGADVSGSGRAIPPLQIAVEVDSKEIVTVLLNHSNPPSPAEVCSFGGGNSIHVAASIGHGRVLELLLNAPGCVDAVNNPTIPEGYTALSLACAESHEDAACILFEAGGFCSYETEQRLPVHSAAQYGLLRLLEIALARYDVDSQTVETNLTPLMIASAVNNIEVVQRLLKDCPDLDLVNSEGYTAVMIAASNDHHAILDLLLDKGASIDIQSHNCSTALCMAANCGCVKALEILLRYNADARIPDQLDHEPFHGAVYWGHAKVVELLLNTAGKSLILSEIEYSTTPLHVACSRDVDEIVEILVEHGADPMKLDDFGRTSIDYAFTSRSYLEALNLPRNEAGASKRRLATTLRGAISQLRGDNQRRLLHLIGRCLMILGHLNDAKTVFATAWTMNAAGKRPQYICDGCDFSSQISNWPRFVCRSCRNLKFCQKCYEAHRKEPVILRCQHHEFLEVDISNCLPEPTPEQVMMWVEEMETRLDLWESDPPPIEGSVTMI